MKPPISIEYVLKALQLPGIGRARAAHFLQSLDEPVTSDVGLIRVITLHSKKIPLPDYTVADYNNAFRKAEIILETSSHLKIGIVSFMDKQYPARLRQIPDFPVVLNYRGDITTLSKNKTIAIIGTRDSTRIGREYAKKFTGICASKDFTIVSGLAAGIDSTVHRSALDVKGITAAILPCGLDQVVPVQNKNLAEKIAELKGVLVSEYFIGESPEPGNFRARDRIQAGLGRGVIVIETDLESGTLHTVDYARSYGKKLACVDFPGHFRGQVNDAGNRKLIREGKVIPLRTTEDLMDFLA